MYFFWIIGIANECIFVEYGEEGKEEELFYEGAQDKGKSGEARRKNGREILAQDAHLEDKEKHKEEEQDVGSNAKEMGDL